MRQDGQGEGLGQALTCGLEDARVALAVPLGKGLHHPVDLLRLPGQPEAPQELPAKSEASRCFGVPRCPPAMLMSLQPPASPLPVSSDETWLSSRPPLLTAEPARG